MALSALEELVIRARETHQPEEEVKVCIIPCGVTYLHRHRFRSSLLVDYGEPIVLKASQVAEMDNPKDMITDRLVRSLRRITLDAPDWETVRTAKMARALYSPPDIRVSLGTHVDMTRLFLDAFAPVARDESAHSPSPSSSSSPLPCILPSEELCALRDDLLVRRPLKGGRRVWFTFSFSFLLTPSLLYSGLSACPQGRGDQ